MGQSPEQKKRIEERRNEVERRTKAKETAEQIADALGVTSVVVKKDRDFLRKQGRLESLPNTEERREIVKRKTEEGKTVKQIASELGTTEDTIEKDKYILIHNGELKSGVVILEEKISERRKEVKRRIEKGEAIQQIAKQLGVSRVIISRDKKYLIDNNMLQDPLSEEERQNKTERLVKAGKTKEQIAKKLGVSISTVKRDKKALRDQNRLTGEEKVEIVPTTQRKKRMKKLEKILEQEGDEKTREQIGKELGISSVTVSKDKARLKEQKEQEFAEWSEKVIQAYDSFYGQPTSIKKFEKYLVLCKERYEQRLIREEHLLPIKYAAIATETYSNVAFYIKLCIRFNQFEEAIKFAKSYANCESFSQEEKGKVKKSIVECEKFSQAINMINNGKISDEEIREVTGLTQVEIALLRKKAEKRANGDSVIKTKEEEAPEVRKHEENDDGDEPEIA